MHPHYRALKSVYRLAAAAAFFSAAAASLAGYYARGPVTSLDTSPWVGRWGSLTGADSVWAWSGSSGLNTGGYSIQIKLDTGSSAITPEHLGSPYPPRTIVWPTPTPTRKAYHWFVPHLRFTACYYGVNASDAPAANTVIELTHSYSDMLDDKTNSLWGSSGWGYDWSSSYTGVQPGYLGAFDGSHTTDFYKEISYPNTWSVVEAETLFSSPNYVTNHTVNFAPDFYEDDGDTVYRWTAVFDVTCSVVDLAAAVYQSTSYFRSRIDVKRGAWLRITKANSQVVNS